LNSTSQKTTRQVERDPRLHRSGTPSDHPHTQNRLKILHGGTIASLVDLGGSLAVASKGHYATGVSTDLTGESRVLAREQKWRQVERLDT
jgi:acyl-coenzyme A thioesterase PaaI-like protein